MTRFLVNKFIKNSSDIKNPKVREAYGLLSGIVGISLNIVLFIFKLIIGTSSNSISIISDAFNNLSDCSNSIITFVGYKLASKPADEKHPFGHGRFEYILSLVLSIIIILVGYELLKNSIIGIFNPEKVIFSYASLIILIVSVLIKIWLSKFNINLGKLINSDALNAIGKDAFNDVIATSATIISLIFSQFINLPIDGFMGVIVSLFILKSGYEIIKDSSSVLLGTKMDDDVLNKIKKIIENTENIIGYHDLMIHNYGEGRQFGFCDVEFDSKFNFIEAHNIIDKMENEIEKETGIQFSVHMDPIDIDDRITSEYYQKIKKIIKDINPENQIHDFRTIHEDNCINLIFDLVVPYEFKLSNDEIIDIINTKLKYEPYCINLKMKIEHLYS